MLLHTEMSPYWMGFIFIFIHTTIVHAEYAEEGVVLPHSTTTNGTAAVPLRQHKWQHILEERPRLAESIHAATGWRVEWIPNRRAHPDKPSLLSTNPLGLLCSNSFGHVRRLMYTLLRCPSSQVELGSLCIH